MSFRNADVLYAAGDAILEKYGTWVWRTLPAEEGRRSFSRSGDARLYDRNMERYRTAESGVARAAYHVHAGDDSWYRGQRLEKSVTPVNDDSARFEPANTSWANSGTGSISSQSAVTSIFDSLPTNGEARSFTVDGTTDADVTLDQSVGSSTGSKEASLLIVEQDDQDKSGIQINDDGGTALSMDYTWSTDTLRVVAGSGTVAREVLSENGPNGGKVVALILITTPNNTTGRRLLLRPMINQANSTAIIHYAHHVEEAFPTSPIPNVGAPSARPADQFSVSPGPAPTAMVGYLSFVAGTLVGESGDFLALVEHGDTTAGEPRLLLNERSGEADHLGTFLRDTDNNSVQRDVQFSSVPKPGDRVEIAYAVDTSDGRLRTIARVNSSDLQDSGTSSPSSWTSPTRWGSSSASNQIVYNEQGTLDGTRRGATTLVRHLIARSSALTNDPFTGTASSVMDELAGHTV